MTETQLIEMLLRDTGMFEAKAVGCPIDVSQTVKKKKDCMFNERERTLYRSIMRSLIFLATRTRPNLSVAASMLASHLHSPTKNNMIYAKRALRYLRGTSNMETNLRSGEKTQLLAYVDASWCNEAERNRGSRSGLMILFGETMIITTSTLQKRVRLSSTEDEYVALSDGKK